MSIDTILSVNSGTDNQQNDELTPLSNTGVKNTPHSKLSVCIDTLRLTGKIDSIDISDLPPVGITDEHILSVLVNCFQRDLGLTTDGQTVPGTDFYKYKQKLVYTDGRPSKSLGFISWGGNYNRDTYLINLTGECCEYLTVVNLFKKLHSLVSGCFMNIKRCDIAFDDFEGFRDVDYCRTLYMDDGFTLNRRPLCDQNGDWTTGEDKKGRTFYVGSRDSGKMLRVYEKGKQLGNPESPWVRWEVELQAKNRVIPHDILLNPVGYFKGSYPCFYGSDVFDLSGTVDRIKTIRKKAKASIQDTIDNVKNTYGKALNTLRQFTKQFPTDSDLLDAVCRDGIPDSLKFVLDSVSLPSVKRTIFPPVAIPDEFSVSLATIP